MRCEIWTESNWLEIWSSGGLSGNFLVSWETIQFSERNLMEADYTTHCHWLDFNDLSSNATFSDYISVTMIISVRCYASVQQVTAAQTVIITTDVTCHVRKSYCGEWTPARGHSCRSTGAPLMTHLPNFYYLFTFLIRNKRNSWQRQHSTPQRISKKVYITVCCIL